MIKFDEKGKARYAEGSGGSVLKAALQPFALSKTQVLGILGIAHLENVSTSEIIDMLLNEDYKLRKKYGLCFFNLLD